VLGFDGFHLDTYGYPRAPLDAHGTPVAMAPAYEAFIRAVRAGRPDDVISFNQVNGVPAGIEPPAPPGFRYVEVWPPNDRWRHLEALMARSAGCLAPQGDTFAIYPPVWDEDRERGLRTVVLTEAIATALGIGTLIWGDAVGALSHPYYVNHERLAQAEADTVIAWHRFGLRCRDLFRFGADTSWYELDDENAAVTVGASAPAKPEPVGGALFTRIVRDANTIVVSLIDLSGSSNGSWLEGTAAGGCKTAAVAVLVEQPERWRACVAVLGRDAGRFVPVELEEASHREGRAVNCEVPIVDGWSVLRLESRER
jgi:dextranase